MALNKKEITNLYRRRAGHYDITANLYYLLGFREFAYRRLAVRALDLKPGDTVVEIGCGTGLNFRLLREAVGSEGKIIGVDLTAEMLAEAKKRVERCKWPNVELVLSDAATYHFPAGVNGIISTFAITLVPEYDQVIRRGAVALSAGGKFVVLDFKKSTEWSTLLIKFFAFITRPFGVSLDLAERHPWESINQYFTRTQFKELYFGGVYISVGEDPKAEQHIIEFD